MRGHDYSDPAAERVSGKYRMRDAHFRCELLHKRCVALHTPYIVRFRRFAKTRKIDVVHCVCFCGHSLDRRNRVHRTSSSVHKDERPAFSGFTVAHADSVYFYKTFHLFVLQSYLMVVNMPNNRISEMQHKLKTKPIGIRCGIYM